MSISMIEHCVYEKMYLQPLPLSVVCGPLLLQLPLEKVLRFPRLLDVQTEDSSLDRVTGIRTWREGVG